MVPQAFFVFAIIITLVKQFKHSIAAMIEKEGITYLSPRLLILKFIVIGWTVSWELLAVPRDQGIMILGPLSVGIVYKSKFIVMRIQQNVKWCSLGSITSKTVVIPCESIHKIERIQPELQLHALPFCPSKLLFMPDLCQLLRSFTWTLVLYRFVKLKVKTYCMFSCLLRLCEEISLLTVKTSSSEGTWDREVVSMFLGFDQSIDLLHDSWGELMHCIVLSCV